MACPTCDHTLEGIESPGAALRYFHCPRCGTFVIRDATNTIGDTVYVPKLVERCREFERSQLAGPEWSSTIAAAKVWHSLGIRESINTPENRT